jgi:hypothetical protein
MAIDPATGMNIPSPADEFRRPRPDQPVPNDRFDRPSSCEMAEVEERSVGFWVSIALVIALLIGGAYYFFGPPMGEPNVRADAGAVTKPEPSPN